MYGCNGEVTVFLNDSTRFESYEASFPARQSCYRRAVEEYKSILGTGTDKVSFSQSKDGTYSMWDSDEWELWIDLHEGSSDSPPSFAMCLAVKKKNH
jgi:hypothetical protein